MLKISFIDGKLNLCLRSLVEFKRSINEGLLTGKTLNEDLKEISDKFEKGMGTILHNAWLHIETLQTTDIDALVHHVMQVMVDVPHILPYLDTCAEKRDLHQRQEVLIFAYAAQLLKRIDDFEESRIMPTFRNKRFLVLGIEFLSRYHEALPHPTLLSCIETLSVLVESEDFNTYRDVHLDLSDSKEIGILSNFKEKCLSDLLKSMESRKIVRPLVDAIDKAKRTHAARK